MAQNFTQDYTLRLRVDPNSLKVADRTVEQWVGKVNKHGVELKINTKDFDKAIQALSGGDIDIEKSLKGAFAKKYSADTLKHDAAILDGVKKLISQNGNSTGKKLKSGVLSGLENEISEILTDGVKDNISKNGLTRDVQNNLTKVLQKALALQSGNFTIDGKRLKMDGLFDSVMESMIKQMSSGSKAKYQLFSKQFNDAFKDVTFNPTTGGIKELTEASTYLKDFSKTMSNLMDQGFFNTDELKRQGEEIAKDTKAVQDQIKEKQKKLADAQEENRKLDEEIAKQEKENNKKRKAVNDSKNDDSGSGGSGGGNYNFVMPKVVEVDKINAKTITVDNLNVTNSNIKDSQHPADSSSHDEHNTKEIERIKKETDEINARQAGMTLNQYRQRQRDQESVGLKSKPASNEPEIPDELKTIINFLKKSISNEKSAITKRQNFIEANKDITNAAQLLKVQNNKEHLPLNQQRLVAKTAALEHFQNGNISQADLDVITEIINRRRNYVKDNSPAVIKSELKEVDEVSVAFNKFKETMSQSGASKSGIGRIDAINSKLNMMKTTMEYFEQAGEHIENILDHSADYVKNMSNLMGTFGKNSHGEVGYSIFDYGYSKGGSLSGDYYNMLSPIDFHSHPYLPNVDDLLPSAQDIKAYAYEFRTQLSNYGKTFLKEAYISNGDKLLKMDFNNLDPKAIDDFERELLETLASVASQYGQEYVVRDSKGAVKNVMYPTGDLGNQITRESRAAMSQVFEKYGLKMGVATRDNRGNLIDDVSGEKWISTVFGEFKSDASLIHEASLLQWEAAQLINKALSENVKTNGGEGASKSSVYANTGIDQYTIENLGKEYQDIFLSRESKIDEFAKHHKAITDKDIEYLTKVEAQYASRIQEIEDMYKSNHRTPAGKEADSLQRLKIMHNWIASAIDKNIAPDYGKNEKGDPLYNEKNKDHFIATILSTSEKLIDLENNIDLLTKTIKGEIPTVKEVSQANKISALEKLKAERDELLIERDNSFNTQVNQINRNVSFGKEYNPLLFEALKIIDENLIKLYTSMGQERVESDRKNGNVINYAEFMKRILEGFLSGNDFTYSKIAADFITALKQQTDSTSLLADTIQDYVRTNGNKELRYTYNRLTDEEYANIKENNEGRYEKITFSMPLQKAMILKLGEALGMQMDNYKTIKSVKDQKTGQMNTKYTWISKKDGLGPYTGSGWKRFLKDFAEILSRISYKDYYEKDETGNYIKVARTGEENPSEKGWYELVTEDNKQVYKHTKDTTIASFTPEYIYGPYKQPLDYGMSEEQSEAFFETLLNAARRGLEERFDKGYIGLDYTVGDVNSEYLETLKALGAVQNLDRFINPDKTISGASISFLRSLGLDKILDKIIDGDFKKNQTVLTDEQIAELRNGFIEAQLGKGLFGAYEFTTHRIMDGIRGDGRITPDQAINFTGSTNRDQINIFNSMFADLWSRINAKLYKEAQRNRTTDFMDEEAARVYEDVERTVKQWNIVENKFEDVVDAQGNVVKEHTSILKSYNGKTLDETFSSMLERTPESRLKELDKILSEEMIEGRLSFKGRNKLADRFGIDIPEFKYLSDDYIKAIRQSVRDNYNVFSPEDIRILKEFGVDVKGLVNVGYIKKFDELIENGFEKTSITTDGDKETYEGHFTTEGLNQLMSHFDVPLKLMEELGGLTESSIISNEDVEKLRSAIIGRPQGTEYTGFSIAKNKITGEDIKSPQKGELNLNIELQKENLDKLFEEEFKDGKFTAEGLQRLVDEFGVSLQRGGQYFDDITKEWVDKRYTITPNTVISEEDLADIKSRALSNILFSSDDNLVGKNISEEIIAQMRRRADTEVDFYTLETRRLKNAREIFLAEQMQLQEAKRALAILEASNEFRKNGSGGLVELQGKLANAEELANKERVSKETTFGYGLYRVGEDTDLFDNLYNTLLAYVPELIPEDFKDRIAETQFEIANKIYDSEDVSDGAKSAIKKALNKIVEAADQINIKDIFNNKLFEYQRLSNIPQEIKDAKAERNRLIDEQQRLARIRDLRPENYGLTSRQIGTLRGQWTKLDKKLIALQSEDNPNIEEIDKTKAAIEEVKRKLGPFAENTTQAFAEIGDALNKVEAKIREYEINNDLDVIDQTIDSKKQAKATESQTRLGKLDKLKSAMLNDEVLAKEFQDRKNILDKLFKKEFKDNKFTQKGLNQLKDEFGIEAQDGIIDNETLTSIKEQAYANLLFSKRIKGLLKDKKFYEDEIDEYQTKRTGADSENNKKYYDDVNRLKAVDESLESSSDYVAALRDLQKTDANISQLNSDIKDLNNRKETITNNIMSEATAEYRSTPYQDALKALENSIKEITNDIQLVEKEIERRLETINNTRSFDKIFTPMHGASNDVNVDDGNVDVGGNGTTIDAEGGIVIHAPKVTITDTDFTDIIKADKVTINAEKAVGGLNIPEEETPKKKEESNSSRSPIDKWKLDESIQAMDKLILKFNGNIKNEDDKKVYDNMIKLRNKLVDLSKKKSYTDDDIKNYKNYKGQIESFKTRNSILGDNDRIYNNMVKTQKDILTKSMDNVNDIVINGLKDTLTTSLTKYADSNNIDGKDKKKLGSRVFTDAAKQVAIELRDSLIGKQNNLKDVFDTGRSEGKVYSSDIENTNSEIAGRSGDFLKTLDKIINGKRISASNIEKSFKDIIVFFDELNNFIDVVKNSADVNAVVGSNAVNSYIRTLSADSKKKSVSYDSDLEKQLNSYIARLNEFNSRPDDQKSQSEFDEIKKESEELRTQIQLLETARVEYQKLIDLRKEIARLSITREDDDLLQDKIDQLETQKENIKNKALAGGAKESTLNSILGTKEEYEAYAKTLVTSLSGLKKSINNTVDRKSTKGYDYTEEYRNNLKQADTAADDLISKLRNISDSGEDALDILQRAYELVGQYDKLKIGADADESIFVKRTQAADLLTSVGELMRNTNVMGVDKADRQNIVSMYNELKDIDDRARSTKRELTDLNKVRYDEISSEVKRLTDQYKQLGVYGLNFFDRIKRSLKAQVTAQIARYFSLYDIIRYVRTGVNVVKELDTAMVELRKVTDGTAKEYEEFRDAVRTTAVDIASTNSNLIQSAADWARLGYSIQEATELAKDAQIFVNVGDGVDIKGATDMMITAMKAFNIEAEDALSIVDKYNEIGNNFALSATDIGDAMQRSASVLAASNTSFDESIALITAGNEIIQDPEKMGTALRTVALRIRGAKSELEEMGEETDYVVNSTSKLRELIKGYTSIGGKYEGFDIMEDEDTFKSLADIIKGIGEVYDEMSDIDRTAMLEKLAGKNRSNALAAMLQNYKQIDNVLRSIENSEGSALEENAHIVDSIQGRITILQTSGENFWQTFINTDAVKNVVTALTDLLNVLTKIIDTVGVAPIITAGAGIGLFGTVGGDFKNVGDYIRSYEQTTQLISELQVQKKEIEESIAPITDSIADDINEAFLEGRMDDVAELEEKMEEACKDLVDVDGQLSDANQALADSFTEQLKPALIHFGITAAISAVVWAVSKVIEAYHKSVNAAHDLAEETQRVNKSLDDYAVKIAQAHEVLNDEKSTTEEIIEAKKQLIDIQNELNESYGNYNDIIKDVNSTLGESTDILIAQREEKLNDVIKEAKTAGVPWEREYEKALRLFFNNSDFSVVNNHSDNSTKILENIDDAIEYYEQLARENENQFGYQGYTVAKETADRLKEQREEYRDIVLAYGESEASDKYNAEYRNLMRAYYKNLQEGTEESEAALRDSLGDLWKSAQQEGDEGIRYWLESMFDAFFDEINNANILERWNAIAEGNNLSHGQRMSNMLNVINNTQEGERKLTEADILSYLNGNELQNVSDRQLDWLKMLRAEVEKAGYNIDEFGTLVKKFTAEGLTRASYDEVNLDTEIEEARNRAIERGIISGEQFDKLGITTEEELTAWNQKVAESAYSSFEEANKMLTFALSKTNSINASKMLEEMEEQYKPTFDALAEAYKAIWSGGKGDAGFDITKVTSEQLHSVSSQIDALNEKLKESGENIIPTEAVDEFILTLEDPTTTVQEAHDAFNNLATLVVDSLVPSLSQASGETAHLIENTLKEMGVVNAEKVTFSRLGYTYEQYLAAKEEAESLGLDVDADLSALEDEDITLIATNELLSQYFTNKIIANNMDIETVDDIKSLLNLCDALGLAEVGILNVAEAEAKLARADLLRANAESLRKLVNSAMSGSVGIQQQIEKYESEAKALEDEVTVDAQQAMVDWRAQLDYDGNTAESSTSDSDSKQKFDWIERAIKKIQRAVTNLGKIADATYKSWGERLDAIMGKTQEFHDEIGRFGQGNIDLYNRPQYINEDGSISTVRSMSFGDEFGNEILVPTIAFDSNGNPYSMSDDEAIARYYETGEYLGLFKSVEEAEEYAEKLHEQQDALYVSGGNSFYAGKYQKLKEEIALQEQAAQAYMQEANAIGLAAEYRNKVMNGMMDIETITDETLKEQISDFQEYYDKATDCEDAIEDLRGELAQLAQVKFDMITKQFEEMALAIDHAATRIGHIQSKISSEGYFESSTLIEQLLFGDKEKLSQLEDEARQLAASIDEAVANGDIEYGSEQWWGMYDSLQNVNDQIVEMKSSMADLNDQLRQMDWDRFDYVQDSIERLRTENDFLVDTLETENQLFEKVQLMNTDIMVSNGNWTDTATAIQGLRVNNLQILQKQNEEVADEIKKINADLANDPNNKKLLERRNTLIDQQQDIIKGITQEKQSIKSLIQEGYETFLDYLQKSIDKRKEALRAEKNLYDYQRTVSDQTKTITDYRKQLAALSGGTDSEENRARLQQLKDDLTKAEKDLQDTEYERWLTDQEEMMDSMYESFENLINEKLDDLEGLIERAIQQTKDNSDSIAKTIGEQADEFIYDLDNTSFGVNFDARISDAVTAVNAVENAINTMISAANVNAQNELSQLQALAQTIVTQAQVQAQQAAQVSVNTNNNGGGGGGGTTTTSTTTTEETTSISSGLSRDDAKKYGDLMTQYQKFVDLANALQKTYTEDADKKARKDAEKAVKNSGIPEAQAAIRNQVYMGAYNAALGKYEKEYEKQIEDYMKTANDFKKQADALKSAIYAKGGTIGSAIKSTGEDGIILARTGEEVLSLERIKQMQGIFKMMQPLAALGTNKTISNIGGTTTVNGMNVSFELPNVTSYEDFVRQAKSDPTFEKLVQNITIGTALGKSKLSKYSL